MLTQIDTGLYVNKIGTQALNFIASQTSDEKKHCVAGFDLDWTLIRTKQGRFPKNEHDWTWLPNRLSVLNHYHHAGYTLVIFTNQNYKGAKLTMALSRINNIILDLERQGLNVWFFVATSKDNYRKPNVGMWQKLENFVNVDATKSIYIGDAAGRECDHSTDDIEFAKNNGLKFYIPESIFPNNQVYIPESQTMFIFVGMPGAGKSTFFKDHLCDKGWVHAEQDKLKTQAKVLSAVKIALKSGKSVAVDATNPNLSKRKEYINLAIEHKIPTMIIYFVGNGYDRNKLREDPVPNIVYNIYYKKLEEPSFETDGVSVVEVM